MAERLTPPLVSSDGPGGQSPDAVAPRRNRALYVFCYLTYGVVALREVTFHTAKGNLIVTGAVLGAIGLLLLTDPFLFRRLRWYRYLYFPLQTALIQALGLIGPYQDIWGALYISVGVQARYYLPIRSAATWGGISAAVMTLTLMITLGWAPGLGFGLTYIAGPVLVISGEVLASQAETARRESDTLLLELRKAHEKLRAYAAQVEDQAAVQERDRLAHQLHDSVGQTIFAITLAAESARELLSRDPARVPELLERLQELTSHALSQMRSLIAQWRPTPGER